MMCGTAHFIEFEDLEYKVVYKVGQLVEKVIKEIRNSGLTVLLVEQNVRSALNTADRGYVLENGRIILEGTSQYLKNNEHVKKAYLGG